MTRGDTQYAAMLASHRADPGNINAAAAAARVRWHTAKTAWLSGYAGRPAIRDTLEEEKRARRALAADVEEQLASTKATTAATLQGLRDEVQRECTSLVASAKRDISSRLAELRGKVEIDAAETLTAELRVIRGGRELVQHLVDVGQELHNSGALEQLAAKIREGLTDGSLTPRLAAYLLGSLSKAAKDLASAADVLISAERRVLGSPQAVVRHTHEHTMADPTIEALEARAADAMRIIAQIREYGAGAVEVIEVPPGELQPAAGAETPRKITPVDGAEPRDGGAEPPAD
jgi:hypothetical protein